MRGQTSRASGGVRHAIHNSYSGSYELQIANRYLHYYLQVSGTAIAPITLKHKGDKSYVPIASSTPWPFFMFGGRNSYGDY